MPNQIKMILYSSNQNNILSSTNTTKQVPNVLMQSSNKRRCALLFLTGNKHCSSCSGK